MDDWLQNNVFTSISKIQFVQDYLGQKCLSWKPQTKRISDIGWDDVEEFLNFHRHFHPRLRIANEQQMPDWPSPLSVRRSGRGVDIAELQSENLYELMKRDSTLVLDSLELSNRKFRYIADSFSAEFRCNCQINSYITFGSTPGFGIHWDDHDVFILQISGRKRWELYGETRKSPTRMDRGQDVPEPTGEPHIEILEPGSLLYVPRGHWHNVIGEGEGSFHLTIGLHIPTVADYTEYLIEKGNAHENFRCDVIDATIGLSSSRDEVSGLVCSLAEQNDTSEFHRWRATNFEPHPRFSFGPLCLENSDFQELKVFLASPVFDFAKEDENTLLFSLKGKQHRTSHALQVLVSEGKREKIKVAVLVSEIRSFDPDVSVDLCLDFVKELVLTGLLVVEGS